MGQALHHAIEHNPKIPDEFIEFDDAVEEFMHFIIESKVHEGHEWGTVMFDKSDIRSSATMWKK